MRIVKRIAFYLLIAVAVIAGSFSISVFLFKDRIIQSFISEANKSLGTPVKIGKIDITAWGNFPDIGIVFTDVYVEDSHAGLYPLFTARSVSFYMNPVDAWNGKYLIRDLHIDHSETHLKINEKGEVNYNISKESKGGSSIAFDLRNVKLAHTKVSYHDLKLLQNFDFESNKLSTDVRVKEDVYNIEADGDVTVVDMEISGHRLLQNKKLKLESELDYNDKAKSIQLKPSQIVFEESLFDLSGDYYFKKIPQINLTAKSKDASIQTILFLFPEEFTSNLKEYQSKGDVYFNLSLKGDISKHRSPLLSVGFGLRNAQLVHPKFKSKLEGVNLEGSFATSSFSNFSTAELFLRNIKAKLNGQPFVSNFSLSNFSDPAVDFEFHGSLEPISIVNFYPLKELSDLKGMIEANVKLSGRLSDLKKKSTAQHVKVDGDVSMQQVGFAWGDRKINFKT